MAEKNREVKNRVENALFLRLSRTVRIIMLMPLSRKASMVIYIGSIAIFISFLSFEFVLYLSLSLSLSLSQLNLREARDRQKNWQIKQEMKRDIKAQPNFTFFWVQSSFVFCMWCKGGVGGLEMAHQGNKIHLI